MTTRVAALLHGKGHDVVTVSPDDSVASLVRVLAERRIGAAPVVDAGGRVIGIVSERDIVRALARSADALERSVAALMTTDVKSCGLEDSVLDIMLLMTSGRFRHLPVIDHDRLVGIVSIGDVVKERLDEAQFELEALKSYIAS
jgi:CBS domain-containing protein